MHSLPYPLYKYEWLYIYRKTYACSIHLSIKTVMTYFSALAPALEHLIDLNIHVCVSGSILYIESLLPQWYSYIMRMFVSLRFLNVMWMCEFIYHGHSTNLLSVQWIFPMGKSNLSFEMGDERCGDIILWKEHTRIYQWKTMPHRFNDIINNERHSQNNIQSEELRVNDVDKVQKWKTCEFPIFTKWLSIIAFRKLLDNSWNFLGNYFQIYKSPMKNEYSYYQKTE